MSLTEILATVRLLCQRVAVIEGEEQMSPLQGALEDTGSTHGGYRQTLSEAPGQQHTNTIHPALDVQRAWP